MKKIIFLILAFATFNQVHSQSETSKAKAKFHRKISTLIQNASQENFDEARGFNMKFDTIYFLLADLTSPEQLISTIIIEYDALERVKSAKIINEAEEDNYNYYYNYIGNQTRFSRLDFYLVENDIEIYDGFQLHIYDQKNTLVSSKEYDVDGVLSYADSIHITYNASNQVTEHTYYYFQEGAWHLNKGTYEIHYNSGLITSYYSIIGSKTQQGEDTVLTYFYGDVIFNKNDPSFLFRNIFEFYEVDSAGVDNFFFSREDAIQYFQDRPIRYNKYKIDGASHPDTLIETSTYTETDHVESLIKDQHGVEISKIHYYFDDEDRLNGLIYLLGADTTNHLTITYNEHGRVQTIIGENLIQVYVEDNKYKIDDKGNLIEYRQDIEIDQESGLSTILRFGYMPGASTKNISASFIKVFPNPSDKYLQLEIPDKALSFYDLKIADMTGKILISGTGFIKNKYIDLNIEQLIPGVYNLVLTSGGERFINRFIKR